MYIDRVLLLTACVNPSGMAFTALQDPKERELQYLTALQWYLDNTSFPIVMCENTQYKLPKKYDKYIEQKRLEYLTFDGNNCFDKSRGKGVGEALIIQYALKHSLFLLHTNNLMKMTGRQILTNINFVTNRCCKENYIYANTFKFELNIKAANSQFFICPKKFLLNYLLKGIDKLNDSKFYFFEHLLYDSMAECYRENKRVVITEFWMPLKIEGYSGTTNAKIQHGHPWVKSILFFALHKLGIYRTIKVDQFPLDFIKKCREH